MRNVVVGGAFVVCWSSGFVGAFLAGDSAGPAPLLAWRYLITAALLLVVAVPSWSGVTRWELAQQATLGILAHVVFLGAVFGAAGAGTDAGTTALVCALQPMLVAVISTVTWGDGISPGQWGGLVLGIVAVALAVGGASVSGPALLLPFAALLGLSASALLERRWRPSVGILHSLTVQVTVSAMVFTAFALATTGMSVRVDSRLIGALGWLVLMSGLGGYASWIAALRSLGPTVTSALLYLTPAVTGVWAWALFGQALTAGQIAGLGLSAAAVVLVTWRPRRRAAMPEPASGVHRDRRRRGDAPSFGVP